MRLHDVVWINCRNGATTENHGRRLLLLLLLKKGRQCKAERESDVHPISPKTPAQQYQPIDRKKRKGKKAEDYSRDRAA